MSIRTSRVGTTAVLEMAHGKANAFDAVFLEALRTALREAAGSDARAVVITAHGGIFSAGMDLPAILAGDRAYLARLLALLSDALAELFALPLPVVAAVNGHAIAGGAILTLACDYRVMARGAGRIGVPELQVGVPFPLVPAEIVRYALGDMRAHRAMLGGRLVDAERAVEEGYVDEMTDPDRLMDRALEVAATMAARPPVSFTRSKANLRRPVLETWARLRTEHDAATLEAWDSPGVRDAIRGYVERTLRR